MKLRNRNFYKELIQKAGAETELVYMKASKELLQKRLYKRNQVLNANSPFVITDEILEHHYHAFQEPWGEGEKVILQKEDIMQYSKEESKAIWNQNAEFCFFGHQRQMETLYSLVPAQRARRRVPLRGAQAARAL